MGLFNYRVKPEEAASQSLIAALNKLNPDNPVTMKDVEDGIAVAIDNEGDSIILFPQEIGADAPKGARGAAISCYRSLGPASGDRLTDLEMVNNFNTINSFLRFSVQDGQIIAQISWPVEVFSADLLDETFNQLAAMSQELLLSVREGEVELPL